MRRCKPTFRWDFESGEGSIGNLESFRELDGLLRADLLKDWIYDLENEYNLALTEFRDLEGKSK